MAEITGNEAVQTSLERGVLTVTLNRPDRGNAWNGAMTRGYFGVLDQAARCGDVRAIVVTGQGKAFCVGGDSEKLSEASESGQAASSVALPFWHPMTIAKPIIAAINGACFGIGLQQALCCDLRFASNDAKFSTAYARRGLVAEFGMSWLLPRLVGTGHAMDLLLSARLARAEEADRIGLVNRVVPAKDLLDVATGYARDLASQCSPRSMQAIKYQLWQDLMSDIASSATRSEDLLAQAASGEDFKEGLKSWMEKRPPAFPPLPEDLAFLSYE
ncbi:enoyl-CoA hydratase-related protein [Novosphingobium malaysiense]|uniref:enoyl-CoA hydratase-related protein n=1 Tax=Novosphingobium malaysiense TaxID=1348853 RepID=UPI00068D2664|nr:enoyl-CoA hydratase-related protein [Novosphingobium malaysiense]